MRRANRRQTCTRKRATYYRHNAATPWIGDRSTLHDVQHMLRGTLHGLCVPHDASDRSGGGCLNVAAPGNGDAARGHAVSPLPMRSLQARILALFLLLMVVVQVGGFVLINTAGVDAARKTVGAEVVAGARVFDRLLEQDTERLVQGARLLTADYAFREAIATGDSETIASVLANHGKRIDATLMMLVGLDQRVIADTIGQRDRPALRVPGSARQGGAVAAGDRDGGGARRSSTSSSSCRCWRRCRSRGSRSASRSTTRWRRICSG